MSDLTYDDIVQAAHKLSPVEQARLIAAVAVELQKTLDASQTDKEKPMPSLAADLYEIAQDLEKNPPTRPGWPGS